MKLALKETHQLAKDVLSEKQIGILNDIFSRIFIMSREL